MLCIAGSCGVGHSFAIGVRMTEVNNQRDTVLNAEIYSLKISAGVKRYTNLYVLFFESEKSHYKFVLKIILIKIQY